jgi:uncharacterized membrane protein
MASPAPDTVPTTLSTKVRLGLSAVVGVAAELLLRQIWPASLAAILAWDAAVLCFLALTYQVLADRSIESMRRRAARVDASATVMMVLIVTAACVSLYGLSLNIHDGDGVILGSPTLRVFLAGLTVLGSWSLIHTVFALHYAHVYYGRTQGGLIFPGGDDPGYWDFMYYSFVVGMTCQVSDVQVSSPRLRRLTLIHGVLSFFFNTVILALAVSIGAGLL